jgi:glycosyltransferase involved in cell wall biosynthesis
MLAQGTADTAIAARRKLSLVIPVYYNAESLPELAKALQWLEGELDKRGIDLDLVFVDDGSGDHSLIELLKIKASRPASKVVKLTRNFGVVQAVRAGLRYVTGDAVAFMSADLQDPVEQVLAMVDAWLGGSRYVLSERRKRADPVFSRIMSAIYYALLRFFVAPDFPRRGYDLRLLDASVAKLHSSVPSYVNPMVFEFWLGFQPTVLEYDRPERRHGKSRWTFRKKFNFLLDTILGFSVRPLRFFSAIGAVVAVLSVLYGIKIIVHTIIVGGEIPGFPTLATLLAFFCSLILLMLGIIGEYIWRIFDQVTHRPESVIDELYL